jgi:hypothetical protein
VFFSPKGRFEVGQNLAIIWSTAPLPDDDGIFVSRVKKWFNEVFKYAFGSGWSLATGHYTQVSFISSYISTLKYGNLKL